MEVSPAAPFEDPLRGAFWNEDWVPHQLLNFDELFAVERPLGQGAFGSTWLLRSRRDNRPYVLKVLHARTDPAELESEIGSLRVLSRFPHCAGHIVCYHDAFVLPPRVAERLRLGRGAPQQPGFAVLMDFVPGRSLQSLASEPDTRARVLANLLPIVVQLLDALARIHAVGFVHRDVKPDNVIVNPEDGALTLVDFGLACRDRCSVAAVSPPPAQGSTASMHEIWAPMCDQFTVGPQFYTAPEAYRHYVSATGFPTDPRAADLFSVGALIYALVQGQAPQPPYTLTAATASKIDPCVLALVPPLLDDDWRRRPTAADALAVLRQCETSAAHP